MQLRSWLHLRSLLLLALPLMACGEESSPDGAPAPTKTEAPAAPTKDETPKAEAAKGETEPAKPSSKLAPASKESIEKSATTLRSRLDEGRKLVKTKDYAKAIEAYTEILKIDPRYGPALGELGWAHFRAGDMDQAHHFTARALSRADDPKRIGMLEYNLGRIAEERGDNESAIAHYDRSLTARPNDTVAKRRAGLAGAGTPPPSPPADTKAPAGLTLLAPKPLPSLEAACKLIKRESMCSEIDECQLDPEAAGERKAGIISGDDFIGLCPHPVVEGPGGWWVFNMAVAGQLGSEIDQNIHRLDARWLDPTTVIFEFTDYAYDRISPGLWDELEQAGKLEEFEGGEAHSKGIFVCRVGEDDVGCTLAYRSEYSNNSFEGTQGEYKAKLTVEGDELVVEGVQASFPVKAADDPSEWDMDVFLPEGRHPIEKLTARK